MGNRDHGAFEVMQEALQPGDRFGVQVVRRFVQQQHVWLFQQQAAQRNTAAFTTGQVRDFGVPVWQAQRIGCTFQLCVQVMAVVCLNDLFQTSLLSCQLVKIRIFFGVKRINLIKAFQRANHFRQRFFNGFTHGVLKVELRFLRQVTNFDTGLWTGFPFDVFIDACHDAQQRRFTGTVQAEYANFRTGEEAEGDVFQNMTLWRYHFANAMHAIDELSHVVLSLWVCLSFG